VAEGTRLLPTLTRVGGTRRLTDDRARTQRVLDLVPQVPTPVWGRDDLKAGEMWNSNSVIAWLIASSGLETDSIQPPASGRAPGWQAGLRSQSAKTRRREILRASLTPAPKARGRNAPAACFSKRE
jgi:hypothetical protein